MLAHLGVSLPARPQNQAVLSTVPTYCNGCVTPRRPRTKQACKSVSELKRSKHSGRVCSSALVHTSPQPTVYKFSKDLQYFILQIYCYIHGQKATQRHRYPQTLPVITNSVRSTSTYIVTADAPCRDGMCLPCATPCAPRRPVKTCCHTNPRLLGKESLGPPISAR